MCSRCAYSLTIEYLQCLRQRLTIECLRHVYSVDVLDGALPYLPTEPKDRFLGRSRGAPPAPGSAAHCSFVRLPVRTCMLKACANNGVVGVGVRGWRWLGGGGWQGHTGQGHGAGARGRGAGQGYIQIRRSTHSCSGRVEHTSHVKQVTQVTRHTSHITQVTGHRSQVTRHAPS